MENCIDQAEHYRRRSAEMRTTALSAGSDAQARVLLHLAEQFERMAVKVLQNSRLDLSRHRSEIPALFRLEGRADKLD